MPFLETQSINGWVRWNLFRTRSDIRYIFGKLCLACYHFYVHELCVRLLLHTARLYIMLGEHFGIENIILDLDSVHQGFSHPHPAWQTARTSIIFLWGAPRFSHGDGSYISWTGPFKEPSTVGCGRHRTCIDRWYIFVGRVLRKGSLEIKAPQIW